MIIGKGWAFIQNPKAGSSACERALSPHRIAIPQGNRNIRPKHETWNPRLHPALHGKISRRGVVVRNPWERMVSGYKYSQSRLSVPFAEFVLDPRRAFRIGNQGMPFQWTPQVFWAAHATDVIDFDDLTDGLRRFMSAAGLPWQGIEQVNVSRDRTDWRNFYAFENERLIDVIADRFAVDCHEWGFTFDKAE